MRASSRETGAAIRATRAEIAGLQKLQARTGAFRDQEARLAGVAARLGKARERVAELKAKMDEAGGSSERLAKGIAGAQRVVADLEGQLETGKADLQDFSRKLEAAGVNVETLADHEVRLAHSLHDANRRLKEQQAELERAVRAEKRMQAIRSTGDRLQQGGARLMAAGAAASLPAVFAAKQAMGFEDAMADVKKVVTFDKPAQFEALRKDILNLSKEVPIAASGIAAIVAAAGRSNVARTELRDFARDAAQMGVAFGMTAEEAGATMAQWRTALKLTQPEVRSLGDKVNALTNKFGGNVTAVSEIITRVGSLGKVAGVAAPEIAAMGALLSSIGVQEDIAATGIKNMTLALVKGTAATKAQQTVWKSLGLEAEAVAKRMQVDGRGTILDVMERISRLSKDKQASALDQLFGSESIGAIAPMLSNLDALRDRFNLLGDAAQVNGSMSREFLARMGTTSAQLELAKNRVSVLAIQIGDVLLPHLLKAAQAFGRWVDKLSAWAAANPGLFKAISMIIGIIGPLLIGLGALGIIAGTAAHGVLAAWKVLTTLATALRWVAIAVRFVTFLMMANPLGALIVGIIAAIGLAAYMIYKHWDTIKAAFAAGVAWIGLKWAQLKASTSAAIQWYLSLGARFYQAGSQLLQGLINGISSKLSALKSKILGVAESVKGWFKNALGIRSPSRVFAGFGGFLAEGLALGIERGAADPIARAASMARRVAAAGSLSLAAPAIAASTMPADRLGDTSRQAGLAIEAGARKPSSVRSSAAARAAPSRAPVTINIYAQPGQSGEEIARAVEEALARRDREAAAAERSSYRDDD